MKKEKPAEENEIDNLIKKKCTRTLVFETPEQAADFDKWRDMGCFISMSDGEFDEELTLAALAIDRADVSEMVVITSDIETLQKWRQFVNGEISDWDNTEFVLETYDRSILVDHSKLMKHVNELVRFTTGDTEGTAAWIRKIKHHAEGIKLLVG